MGGAHGQVGPLLFQSVVSKQENVKIRSYKSRVCVCVCMCVVCSTQSDTHRDQEELESSASHHVPPSSAPCRSGNHERENGPEAERSPSVREEVSEMGGESREV